MRLNDPKIAVCVLYVAAMFMNGMDATIVNVALPAIGADYGIAPSATSAVNIGYLVSLAVFVPSSGWIADRFGPKRTFQTAVVVFTAASVLCGLAGAMWMLIGARVLQGIGGGMLAPVGQAMLFRAFPAHERAKASAVLAVPVTIAPTLGPLLGGLLVEYAGWRWIFFINVPVGLIALLFTVLFLEEEQRTRAGRFDPARARAAGIPMPYWKTLQRGEPVGGCTPEQVLGAPRRGLKVVYATDTRPCAALEAAARDADLLCMDATYADDADLPKARLYGHTTCREAGALAAAAAVRRLWLTHYSAAVTDTAPGLAAARTAYPLALAGYDGMAQELEFDKE